MNRRSGLLLLGLLVLAASTSSVPAQSGGAQSSMRFRMGGFLPTGTGEVWQANESLFTLDHSDFDDFMFGTSFVTSMGNHSEIGFNFDYYDAAVRSAYRDFEDQRGNAILHDTFLRVMPFTVDLRFLPGGRYAVRGERGDRLVRKPVFFLGIGAGANYWEYEEVGDFVGGPILNPTIFTDRVVDDGFAPEAHALVGVEVPVGPAFSFTAEARYSWSEAELGGRFSDIYTGKLDLSGASLFGGISFQF